MNLTLDRFVKEDPRILTVYLEVRRRFADIDLCHHNFGHILRDLHRALVIAATERSVNYSVLVPGVLLHDIGFCTEDFRELGHDVAGEKVARKILFGLSYDEPTCNAICHCIRSHKGKAELPRTIEARILYDADVLEKAGLVYVIYGGKIIHEFRESLEDFLHREISHREIEITRGFFNAKAREMDGGGLERVRSLLSNIREELKKDRPDFSICEKDLWSESVPE